MSKKEVVIRCLGDLPSNPTRRDGISEKRLLSAQDSSFQNIVHLDAEEGSEVEFHRISTSESIFIMNGTFEILLNGGPRTAGPGCLIHFPPGNSHGFRCVKGPGQFLAIFAPPATTVPDDSWLQHLYSESWQQYRHEDNLGLKRTAVFLAAQAGLIAILGLFASAILQSPSESAGAELHVDKLVAGIAIAIVSVVALMLLGVWRGVTKAGRQYLNLRWISARAIEVIKGLDPWGPAGLEDTWKREAEGADDSGVMLFPRHPALTKYKLQRKVMIRGWNSLEWLMIILSVLWAAVFVAGMWTALSR